MKTFIVAQMVISKDTPETSKKVVMFNIIRQVKADSKESAIGKFVIGTQDIEASKKLNIECYDLLELNEII